MRWLAVILAFVCVALIVLGLGGCRFSKDGVLSAYESVVQFAGQFALTPAIQLQGVRAFGEDHFRGRIARSMKTSAARNTSSAAPPPWGAMCV